MNTLHLPYRISRATCLFLALLCVVLFTAQSALAATKTIDESSKGKLVRLKVGDTLKIRLKSNPSTGYSWTALPDHSPQLEENTDAEKKTAPPSAPTLPGAPTTQLLVFKAKHHGTNTLKLQYHRPWEKTATPASEFEIKVQVK